MANKKIPDANLVAKIRHTDRKIEDEKRQQELKEQKEKDEEDRRERDERNKVIDGK